MKQNRNSLGFNKKPENTRVVVAMSGGVDSSVVAAMLKQEKYEVIGMTLQLYNQKKQKQKKGTCCAGQDIFDAKRVAEKMNFPHYVLDYEKQFKKDVIDPFTQAYINGETPIPCVACNQTVKFSDLLKMAKQLNADCLATGHYIISKEGENGNRQMYRPVDEKKDQSYFLFATTQEQLNFLRFPLGDMPKTKTRNLAKEMELSIAEKSDSQDICFVPKGNYAELITKLRPEANKKGLIIHTDGRVLAEHDGIVNFTIGQRRGLGVADKNPLYVVDIDAEKNVVLVGGKSELKTQLISLRDVNWIGDAKLSENEKIEMFVRVRSTHKPQKAQLFIKQGIVNIKMEIPQDGLAKGQACVFYENQGNQSRVLGGGWIDKVEKPITATEVMQKITLKHSSKSKIKQLS